MIYNDIVERESGMNKDNTMSVLFILIFIGKGGWYNGLRLLIALNRDGNNLGPCCIKSSYAKQQDQKGKVINMSDSYNTNNMLPKNVMIEDCKGNRDTEIITHQFKNGRLFLVGTIDQRMAVDFISAMLVLAEEQKDVEIIIDSPGGEVSAGLMIYDILKSYKYKITMYCTGFAASMAALILAGGQKGRRFILPHSQVMIHEPLISSGFGGSATSIEKTAQRILETKAVLNKILAEHTGRSVNEINKATKDDNFMTSEEAVQFGICDEIRSIF